MSRESESRPAPAETIEGSAWVVMNPRYQRGLERQGLIDAQAFLALPGDVISGHAERNVTRVVLGTGRRRFAAYLKCEHRVRWRDRAESMLAGFGGCSKSEREGKLLRMLAARRIAGPRWMAYGEDGQGRAFLLVRAVTRATDLRTFLEQDGDRPHWHRHALARNIGALLARVHSAGLDCPDLLSKHVLVRARSLEPVFIDWQRAQPRRWVPWSIRIRDLAMLHASLVEPLASRRERLACLHAYRKACTDAWLPWRLVVRAIDQRAVRLRRHRSVRDLRQPTRLGIDQRLRWIQGESLCVTRSFHKELRGRLPDWLRALPRLKVASPCISRCVVGQKPALLRLDPPATGWQRLRATVLRRRVTSPGVRQAGLLFRLQRYGVRAPRLLAFGQKPDASSLLLFQVPEQSQPLAQWLEARPGEAAGVLWECGRLLRRLHQSGCRLSRLDDLHVAEGQPLLVDPRHVRSLRFPSRAVCARECDRIVAELRLSAEARARWRAGYAAGLEAEAALRGPHFLESPTQVPKGQSGHA